MNTVLLGICVLKVPPVRPQVEVRDMLLDPVEVISAIESQRTCLNYVMMLEGQQNP